MGNSLHEGRGAVDFRRVGFADGECETWKRAESSDFGRDQSFDCQHEQT